MPGAWTLAVDRDDFSRTTLLEQEIPKLDDGEVLLQVERVGLTANNVTYAVLGDAFRYWQFFPTEPGWGVIPLWGFGQVVEATRDDVKPGGRVYGYFPSASHLVIKPDRADERGFRDASAHRVDLPAPYNVYSLTTTDPAYDADHEDLLILFRPLFVTSFMLADQIEDNDWYGAKALALSSASSKTAYGAAFLLRGAGPELIGLTSPGNVEFTESLGCYDRVLTYDEVEQLDPGTPTAYLDFSGSADVRARVRARLQADLVRDVIVGLTHQEPAGRDAISDSRTTVFFAPDQMRKRAVDWGREEMDERFADAWHRFLPTVETWVDVVVQRGPDALRDVWLAVLSGQSAPRTGHVVAL